MVGAPIECPTCGLFNEPFRDYCDCGQLLPGGSRHANPPMRQIQPQKQKFRLFFGPGVELGLLGFLMLAFSLEAQQDGFMVDPTALNIVTGLMLGLVVYSVLLVLRGLVWCGWRLLNLRR